MDNQTDRWVAIVYDGTDKISSRGFTGNDKDNVRVAASEWVESHHGIGTDWSLHHVCEKDS
ncbi:hypothetical protein H8E06_00175 [bacterium]|nr:hypothetical protein [bacterium]